MSTGIESWTDLEPIDALFPFVGSEIGLVIVTTVLWIGFHVWHARSENREYSHSLAVIAEQKAAETAVADTISPATTESADKASVTS